MPFLYEKMIYRRTDDNVTFNNFYLFYQTKQIDSMLPSVCPLIDSSQKTPKYGGNNSDALICTSGALFSYFCYTEYSHGFKVFRVYSSQMIHGITPFFSYAWLNSQAHNIFA